MNSTSIICPNCKSTISIDEALKSQIEEEFKKNLEQESRKHINEEKDRFRKQMLEWQEKEKNKLEQESVRIRGKIKQELDLESKRLKVELEEKDKKLIEARELEVKLRREKNDLDDRTKNLELEVLRKVDEEKEKIRKQAEASIQNQYELKLKEKDKLLQDANNQAIEMKRRLNQTSQQLQGEVQELEIEERLRVEFPMDEIVEVGKGIRGADIIQKVFDNNKGSIVGIIVWESKRTYKSWDKEWLVKLKEDQAKEGGNTAVIVSNILPEDVKGFALRDGVYISSFDNFVVLAGILRHNIIKHNDLVISNVGKDIRMEGLFNYLRSPQFASHVQSIMDGWTVMLKQVDDEQRAMERQWATRKKALERVMKNTMGMYGDIQGLMGSALPELDELGINSLGVDEKKLLSASLTED